MAQTLYWEARSEGDRGMLAVGWVVLNRLHHPQFPDSICAVVRQGGKQSGCQFSFWCDGQSEAPRELGAWRRAQHLAHILLRQPPPDPTGGALFYHHQDLPSWNRHQRIAQLGEHVFYR